MTNLPSGITSIAWSRLFPWLILARAARVSLMIRVIALALLGVLLTHVGWRLIEGALLDRVTDSAPRRLESLRGGAFDLVNGVELPRGFVPPLPPPAAVVSADSHALSIGGSFQNSPVVRGWRWAMEPLVRLYEAEGWRQWLGYFLASVWTASVWALLGGAIARIAAIFLCYGEKIGPWAAIRAAAKTWKSTAGAVALPALVAALIALPLILVGTLLRADFTAAVMGVCWLFAIAGGLVLALLVIGLALGWPLMWSTVAVERTDAFDAVSRGYGYVYQRPLHLAFYIVIASLIGLLAQLAVNVIVDGALAATDWAVSLGAGQRRLAELHGLGSLRDLELFAARRIRFWESALAWVAAGFPMAYLWPSAVAIYLLQRRHIDATELTEVVFDEGEPQQGLPPLAADPATGVPAMPPEGPANDPGATTAPYPAST